MGTRQAVKHCSRLYVQLSIPVAENRALLMVSSQQLLVGSRSYAARVPHKAPFEDDRAASIFSQLSICNRVNRVLSVLKVTKGDFWTHSFFLAGTKGGNVTVRPLRFWPQAIISWCVFVLEMRSFAEA